MSAEAAKAWLTSGEPPRLIDVREPEEWEICRLPAAELLPMSQFATLVSTQLTDPSQPLLIYCHHGVRSAHVAEYLSRQGFTQVVNLGGGIDAWSREVDPSVTRY
ncbi:MAG: rhodanese [Verrucomicrobiaceae bacterium]|nr:MAG: rhodanese [Verrucomicrobiaceae bacterium]